MGLRALAKKINETLRAPRELAEAVRTGVNAGLEEFTKTWAELPERTLLGAARNAPTAQAILINPTRVGEGADTCWRGVCLLETRTASGNINLLTIGTLTLATPGVPPTPRHVRSIRIEFESGQVARIVFAADNNTPLLLSAGHSHNPYDSHHL